MTSELTFSGGGHVRALVVRRSPQARRMRLSVDPRDGTVRLMLPGRAALKASLAWAEGQRGWVEDALGALPSPRPIVAGGTIPLEGTTLRIDWHPDHPRAPALLGEPCPLVSSDAGTHPPAPKSLDFARDERGEELVLRVGGPEGALASRTLRWLRVRALETLTAESGAFAAKAGVALGRVSVGDPRGRWGSCSSSGDLRYSWRLILAPPEVREATVAHEVAHRLHMDHSPAFHAAAETLLGRDGKAERAWLRRHGAALHWVGRAP